jgi:hypothetical protein
MEAHPATTDAIAADALRHAADCVEQLKEKGEPMGPHQTFRRGYDAADQFVVDSPLTGDKFNEAVDVAGDAIGMALDHEITGTDAAEFYRNKADAIEE